MIAFLTFNEQPSGILSSQVIDVIKFLRIKFNIKISFVCFISIRNFFKNRRIILNQLPDAFVIPMFPGLKRWRFNRFLLFFILKIYKIEKVIARSVWATQLALMAKERGIISNVVYDGRGAIYHEFTEYQLIQEKSVVEEIKILEQNSILKSDFQLAISYQLINHWRGFYNYDNTEHVVIPCTISTFQLTQCKINSFPFLPLNNFVIGVYCGSFSGWQSVDLLYSFVALQMQLQSEFRFLIITPDVELWRKFTSEFGDRVFIISLESIQVISWLKYCDYGFLIRENSVTNQVAAPVKFAEYLSAGLKVVISDNIGDYSSFVLEHNCGHVIRQNNFIRLDKVTDEEKFRFSEISDKYFSKESYVKEYSKILEIKYNE